MHGPGLLLSIENELRVLPAEPRNNFVDGVVVAVVLLNLMIYFLFFIIRSKHMKGY